MEASCVTHIGICVRDMDTSLAFYRDALGMEVLGDRPTDPTEGGRPHNYKHRRTTRRWVSLAYGTGATPTLTLTSHPGEEPDGQPILLDQVGISHISFGVNDVKALAAELIAKGIRSPSQWSPSPTPKVRSTAYTYETLTESWSNSTNPTKAKYLGGLPPREDRPIVQRSLLPVSHSNMAGHNQKIEGSKYAIR